MIHIKQLSSLEKVTLDYNLEREEFSGMSVLLNEEFAYQIAYVNDELAPKEKLKVTVNSPLKGFITLKTVENIPSEFPVYFDIDDDDYISKEPGLFPDLLKPFKTGFIEVTGKIVHAIWVNVKLDGSIPAGIYPIEIVFENENCEFKKIFNIEITDASLPEQEMLFTQWFHADCIAEAYNVKVFSKKHWELIGKFMKTAAENGINTILTPIFTPPLDTEIGGERLTVQLVDVEKTKDGYKFGFERFAKWIDIAKENGITHFEICHLFTQWGAKAAPKIIARVNGRNKRIFGWDTVATGGEYKEFLSSFLPALTKEIKRLKIEKNTLFHISDEPDGEEHMKNYLAAKVIVAPYLKEFKIIDALSQLDFYKNGAVENPVPVTATVEEFVKEGVNNLWTYYCCTTKKGLCNRYLSMPSYRNRAIGLQLWKYDIKGFLHWGYNFYHSVFSREIINPFLVTDGKCAYPSGDAFSVYPGDDGPWESIRLKVFCHALQDMRALRLLEDKLGKEKATYIIEEILGEKITFKDYPHSAEKLLEIREKVNYKVRS